MGNMIKKIGLATTIASALVLSGCGGGSGNTDPMNDKNYVAIYTNVPAGVCESTIFINALTDIGLRDFITRETDGSTSCATYGKVQNDVECAVEYLGGGTQNCIVGFNEIPAGYNSNGLARQVSPVKLFDTMELISATMK